MLRQQATAQTIENIQIRDNRAVTESIEYQHFANLGVERQPRLGDRVEKVTAVSTTTGDPFYPEIDKLPQPLTIAEIRLASDSVQVRVEGCEVWLHVSHYKLVSDGPLPDAAIGIDLSQAYAVYSKLLAGEDVPVSLMDIAFWRGFAAANSRKSPFGLKAQDIHKSMQWAMREFGAGIVDRISRHLGEWERRCAAEKGSVSPAPDVTEPVANATN